MWLTDVNIRRGKYNDFLVNAGVMQTPYKYDKQSHSVEGSLITETNGIRTSVMSV